MLAIDVVASIMQRGLEVFGRYLGAYDFIVTNTKDPKALGRVQGYCPYIGQDACPYDPADERDEAWVKPNFPGAGAARSGSAGAGGTITTRYGCFWPPEEGDVIKVVFRGGDPERPDYYLGGWYARDEQGAVETPEEFQHAKGTAPKKRGWKTPGGHLLIFDDTTGARVVKLMHANGSLLSLDEDGIATLKNQQGSEVVLDGKAGLLRVKDQHGNELKTNADGVRLADKFGTVLSTGSDLVALATQKPVEFTGRKFTANVDAVDLVRGADRHVPLGEDLLQYLTAHALTPHGPAGTPAAPPPATLLSRAVRIK